MDSKSAQQEASVPQAGPAEAPVAAAQASASPAVQNNAAPTPALPVTEIDADDYRFYARVFTMVSVAILGVILYKIVVPFFGPIIWAMFLAFLLHPLHLRLSRQLKGRDNLSASLITIATFVMLVGPLAALSAAFAAQAAELVQWAQEALGKQTRQQYTVLNNAPIIGEIIEWLRQSFGVKPGQIQNWIAQVTQNLPQLLAGLGGKIFMGAINTVFAFVLMLFMFYFFVRDGAATLRKLRVLIPMPRARRELLGDHVASVTRAVVFGTGVTALVQGTLVCLAFLITGLSSPLVFGVLAALLALLPIGGTAFVWIPALIVLTAQDRWGMAVVMLIIGLASSSADNVLRPLLISGRAQVGTLTIFIGVLGGTAAFGPIGLFLGPVLLALIIALVQFALEIRRTA